MGGHGELRELPSEESAQAPPSLARIQEVLNAIFDFYSLSGHTNKERRLTSARFQRMALDSSLLDDRLTSAKVDVVFHRVCGASPHMMLQNFLDSIVRLAAAKYPPPISPTEGVSRLFMQHLSSFSIPGGGPFEGLDEDTLLLSSAARSSLKALYEGYFACECNQQMRPSTLQSESQNAFLQLLTDFEVTPDLAPKSIAFAVYREIARFHDVPSKLRTQLIGDGPVGMLGRGFTYVHFVVAMTTMARRCFSEEGWLTLARLFEWMDASKGRVIFASLHPGHLPGGPGSFRILPDGVASQVSPAFATGGGGSVGSSSGDRRISYTERKAAIDQRRSWSGAAVASGGTGGSEVFNGGSPRSPRAHGSHSGVGAAGGFGWAEVAGSDDVAPIGLDAPWARRLVQQIFGHYTALGDPLNRTHLSTLKFNRFVRDCGLVSPEACGAVSFQFVPADRARSSSTGRTPMRSGRSSGIADGGSNSGRGQGQRSWQALPLAPAPGKQRGEGCGAGGAANFTVSPSRPVHASSRGLPLRVFASPPLTQVEVDLIFVQATQKEGASSSDSGTRGSGSRRSTSGPHAGTSSFSNSAPARTIMKRHHMVVAAFRRALFELSCRCFPKHSNSNATFAKGDQAFDAFCTEVLLPLSDALLEVKGQDVSFAATLIGEPDAVRLLQRCQPGLEKVFLHYSQQGDPDRRAHWNIDIMMRFAHDFELTQEVSHLPLQRIFRDCTHYESCSGHGSVDGEMSFVSFQLALVMVAQKVYGVRCANSLERVVHLFHRMNGIAGTSSFQGPSCRSEVLIPKLGLLELAVGKQPPESMGHSVGSGRAYETTRGHSTSVPPDSRSDAARRRVVQYPAADIVSWSELVAT